MTHRMLALGTLALALVATGCVYSHAGPGVLYMDVKGPLGEAKGTPGGRSGEACAMNLFGIVAAGDASIDAAKKNGSVADAKTVSYHSTNVLGFGNFCTVVDD